MSTEVKDGPAAPADRTTGRRRPPAGSTSPLFTDDHPGVSRLYTVAMMADVLRAPETAVRHWIRSGLLVPVRRSGSIAWCDFPQLVAGRELTRLLRAGLSLREIDAGLRGLAPDGVPDAARDAERIVADGRRLSIRRDDRLLGAGGQMQLAFYAEDLLAAADDRPGTPAPATVSLDAPPPDTASFASAAAAARPRHAACPQPGSPAADRGACVPRGGRRSIPPAPSEPRLMEPFADESAGVDPDEPDVTGGFSTAAELLDLAADLESTGALTEAAEALRAVLQAQGPSAQIVFMLAELLYRAGDLTAARERYYAAVELDADHLEARASLGCVLAELGDHELALAALEGVLRQEPDYADAHWHLAGVLAAVGRGAEARLHLRTFLRLAPESPWATAARERLEAHEPAGT